FLRSTIVRSYVAAPLVARGRTLGAIHLMMGESGRTFSQGDLPFVEDLARRAASAVENARLYREAQEAVVAREEFLAIASHELRTPLTAFQLAVQRFVKADSKSGAGAGVTCPAYRERDETLDVLRGGPARGDVARDKPAPSRAGGCRSLESRRRGDGWN